MTSVMRTSPQSIQENQPYTYSFSQKSFVEQSLFTGQKWRGQMIPHCGKPWESFTEVWGRKSENFHRVGNNWDDSERRSRSLWPKDGRGFLWTPFLCAKTWREVLLLSLVAWAVVKGQSQVAPQRWAKAFTRRLCVAEICNSTCQSLGSTILVFAC